MTTTPDNPIPDENSDSLPDRSSAVSATASRTDDGVAVTLINRHYHKPASVRLACADAPDRSVNGITN